MWNLCVAEPVTEFLLPIEIIAKRFVVRGAMPYIRFGYLYANRSRLQRSYSNIVDQPHRFCSDERTPPRGTFRATDPPVWNAEHASFDPIPFRAFGPTPDYARLNKRCFRQHLTKDLQVPGIFICDAFGDCSEEVCLAMPPCKSNPGATHARRSRADPSAEMRREQQSIAARRDS